ncbi:hypothetical protein NDN08_002776 [Rhodosorus marinus]|uniref:Uncharacterized protein n=1 Tax=Rhodosorus marinus TaxID=101924 RepID=A0AAV8UXD3_9RHOD|nr:hypothetical protein NDN08_002776 [Rhodosorus marinus]
MRTWLCFSGILLLITVSVKAQTCLAVAQGGLGRSIEVVGENTLKLGFEGVTVATVGIRAQPDRDPLCVRLTFTAVPSFSLVSIRAGLFATRELISAPVKYPNRRNVSKHLRKKGLPADTLVRKLSMVICQDEIAADDRGCCEDSTLYLVTNAIVKEGDSKSIKAEPFAGREVCTNGDAQGPGVTVCEVPIQCSCDPLTQCSYQLDPGADPVCISRDKFSDIVCSSEVSFLEDDTGMCTCTCSAEDRCIFNSFPGFPDTLFPVCALVQDVCDISGEVGYRLATGECACCNVAKGECIDEIGNQCKTVDQYRVDNSCAITIVSPTGTCNCANK